MNDSSCCGANYSQTPQPSELNPTVQSITFNNETNHKSYVLRKVLVLTWLKKAFREESERELFGEPDIVGMIRGSRLRWGGNMLRKNVEKIGKTVY